jgi:hypothetical protein
LKSLNKTGWISVFVISALIYGAIFGSDEEPDPVATPSPTASEVKTEAPETAEPETESTKTPEPAADSEAQKEQSDKEMGEALQALATIPIKGRAPKTGYERELFASGWQSINGCDMRNRILSRDLIQIGYRAGSSCVVETGVLNDPFTGRVIGFQRGVRTSLDVQIDHVVSLSDAWQKGAQQLSSSQRFSLYNDPLNLLAVWGPANSQKSDSDAASWLPPNKGFRCAFVARQVAVKGKYALWVTQAEHDTIARVLSSCPEQNLPR